MKIHVSHAGPEDVASLAPLWKAMVEHHRAVVAEPWPVRAAEEAWALRRQHYLRCLERDSGFVLLARRPDFGEPVGYCFCELAEIGPTFDLGDRVGDVGSLAVAADARGAGVGTALLGACRAELSRRGIAYWSIGVVEGNDGARSLYERVGFRPWFRSLLSPLDDASPTDEAG